MEEIRELSFHSSSSSSRLCVLLPQTHLPWRPIKYKECWARPPMIPRKFSLWYNNCSWMAARKGFIKLRKKVTHGPSTARVFSPNLLFRTSIRCQYESEIDFRPRRTGSSSSIGQNATFSRETTIRSIWKKSVGHLRTTQAIGKNRRTAFTKWPYLGAVNKRVKRHVRL